MSGLLRQSRKFIMKENNLIAVLCLVVSCWSEISDAYSSGGPETSCSSLMPGHGVDLQSGQAPYQVTLTKGQVNAGSEVTATITGSKAFKGFFIRVKQGDNYVAGEFTDNGGHKDRCSKSGVTHKDPTLKNSVSVTFRFPADMTQGVGNPKFIATVVEEKRTIWQVMSQEITVTAGISNPVEDTTTGNGASNSNTDDDDDDDDGDGDTGVAMEVCTGLILTSLVVVWLGLGR